MEGEHDPRKRLKYFKGQRTYKKGAITTRIRELDALVANGGSRRLIKTMSDGLLVVFQELTQVCDEISYISEEFDDLNSVEEIRVRVEMCVSMAHESLEVRAYDPPSTETSSWVQKHAEMVHEEGVLDLERDVRRSGNSNVAPTPVNENNSEFLAANGLGSSYGVYDASNWDDLVRQNGIECNVGTQVDVRQGNGAYGEYRENVRSRGESNGVGLTQPGMYEPRNRYSSQNNREFVPDGSRDVSHYSFQSPRRVAELQDINNSPIFSNLISNDLNRGQMRDNSFRVVSGDPRLTQSEVGLPAVPVSGRRRDESASDIVRGAQSGARVVRETGLAGVDGLRNRTYDMSGVRHAVAGVARAERHLSSDRVPVYGGAASANLDSPAVVYEAGCRQNVAQGDQYSVSAGATASGGMDSGNVGQVVSVPSAVSRSGGALPHNYRNYPVVGSRCTSTAAQIIPYENARQAVSTPYPGRGDCSLGVPGIRVPANGAIPLYPGPGDFSQDVPGAFVPAQERFPLGNAQNAPYPGPGDFSHDVPGAGVPA